jgi:hypothetical protein
MVLDNMCFSSSALEAVPLSIHIKLPALVGTHMQPLKGGEWPACTVGMMQDISATDTLGPGQQTCTPFICWNKSSVPLFHEHHVSLYITPCSLPYAPYSGQGV